MFVSLLYLSHHKPPVIHSYRNLVERPNSYTDISTGKCMFWEQFNQPYAKSFDSLVKKLIVFTINPSSVACSWQLNILLLHILAKTGLKVSTIRITLGHMAPWALWSSKGFFLIWPLVELQSGFPSDLSFKKHKLTPVISSLKWMQTEGSYCESWFCISVKFYFWGCLPAVSFMAVIFWVHGLKVTKELI